MQERQRATQFSFHQMISSFHSHSYGLDAHAHIIALFVSMTALPYAMYVNLTGRPSASANQAAVNLVMILIHVMKLLQSP